MKICRYILTAVLATAFAGAAFAQQSDRKDVRRGNRQFEDGEFKKAVVDYQKALLRDSTSFPASYNLANALYRLGNFQEARAVLDTVASSAPESGHAADYYFNLGNTAVAMEDYQAAVDAYRNSLLLNPGDMDAKENYIYARKMLEDQQNQNQNQNQDDQNQQNQDNRDNSGNDRGKDKDDNQDDNRDRNQDGNRDREDQDNNQGRQPQNQPSISKQAAQQMLNAIMAKEKETQDKVKKEKAAVMKSKQKEKNW